MDLELRGKSKTRLEVMTSLNRRSSVYGETNGERGSKKPETHRTDTRSGLFQKKGLQWFYVAVEISLSLFLSCSFSPVLSVSCSIPRRSPV